MNQKLISLICILIKGYDGILNNEEDIKRSLT